MVSLKHLPLLLFGLLLTVFIAACSSPFSNNTTTGSTTANNNNGSAMSYGNTSAKATPTAAMGSNMGSNKMATPTAAMGGNMGSNKMAAPTAAMGGNMGNALIQTTQVKLNGKMITVLTNAKGMVLYHKLDDMGTQSSCTAMNACAKDWPPVLATDMNMMTVTSSMQLPHKLTIVKTANGNQIEYDGHPLYTYAGDMMAGQFTGRGMDKVWYLVSPAL